MFKPDTVIEFDSGREHLVYVVVDVKRWEKDGNVRNYVTLRLESGDGRKGIESLCLLIKGVAPKDGVRVVDNVWVVLGQFANSAIKKRNIVEAIKAARTF